MKNRRKRWKQKNRGASFVMVIGAVALVSVLVMMILSMSLINMQMKAVNHQSLDNFYDAESAMDEIRTGLQQEVSLAATTAYIQVMEHYSDTNFQNEQRRNTFINTYRNELRNRLKTLADENIYDLDKLKNYIGQSHRFNAATNTGADLKVQSGKTANLVFTNTGVVIQNLEIEYRDSQDFVSIVDTDIVMGYPNMNFTQAASVPDLLRYCIVADGGLDANNVGRSLTLDGNVYAGNYTSSGQPGGITVESGKLTLATRNTLIARGGIDVLEGSRFDTGARVTLWTDNFNLKRNSNLQITGTAYVADDLTIEGSGSATLSGEYYGYGNPNSMAGAASVDPTDVIDNPAKYSSAMIINGIAKGGQASIYMTGLTTLMLAGNAYIGGGAMMGESLAVKSSQIAYMAPADCFNVPGMTNPTSEYDNLDQEEFLNKNALAGYHASGVTKLVNTDGLYYYFLHFANAKDATLFYQEYYGNTAEGKAHTEKRDQYLSLYVENQKLTIREGNRVNQILNGGILVWDNKGIRSIVPQFNGTDTDISDDAYYMRLQSGWMDMYNAYNRNLTSDYERLSTQQRNATVFENLVDVDALNGLVSAGSEVKFSYTDVSGKHTAYVCRNTGGEINVSSLPVDANEEVSMIIATGDVKVTTDFEGIILAGGQIKVDLNSASGTEYEIKANSAKAASLIQNSSYTVAATTHTLYELLKDSDYYAGSFGAVDTEGSKIDIKQLITYRNWSKE